VSPEGHDDGSGKVPPELAAWLADRAGTGRVGRIEPLLGGNSNATYRVVAEAGTFVLRRPPVHALSKSAHSMEREHQVLSALVGTGVPVPTVVAICTDPAVFGAPFLVMDEVVGVPLTDSLPARYGPGAVAGLGHEMVDVLARLHSVDVDDVGLSTFGRPEGFLERQVGRWRTQYRSYAVRDLPAFEAVATWLGRNRPKEQRPGILHGDFHIDNCLWATDEPRLLAVIDWELSTVGDPLLDLGLCLALWGDRPVPAPALDRIQAVSRASGSPKAHDLAERYALRSGRPVGNLAYYLTLALWRLAAILEGAYAQHIAGHLDSDYARGLRRDVPVLLEEAALHAGVTVRP
jgi:aminoglycoside phosphotransferase (APT) family kinase protein